MGSDRKWRDLVLSVVVPMYNEAENAPFVLQTISDALEGQLNYELIVVNDGSSDETQNVLCQLQLKYPRLKVIRHLHNKGQSAAIINGVKNSIAPWIATLDGDGQNDPRDIVNLFQYAAGFDPHRDNLLIVGIRSERQDSWLRRASSRLANLFRQILFRDGCPDAGSGLKIFPRQLFLNLPHFDHMHRFLPALIKREKGTTINVPVSHHRRILGHSKYGVWNRLWISLVDIFGISWLLKRDVSVEVEVLASPKNRIKHASKNKIYSAELKKEVAIHDQ